jgi:hypothetical protein
VFGKTIEGNADDALNRNSRGQKNDPSAPPRAVGRPNDKLQAAVRWLENALQDNQPQRTKVLRENAKGEANIASDTLDRAFTTIGAKSLKIAGHWNWKWTPLSEPDENDGETAQQSMLIQVEGAE